MITPDEAMLIKMDNDVDLYYKHFEAILNYVESRLKEGQRTIKIYGDHPCYCYYQSSTYNAYECLKECQITVYDVLTQHGWNPTITFYERKSWFWGDSIYAEILLE